MTEVCIEVQGGKARETGPFQVIQPPWPTFIPKLSKGSREFSAAWITRLIGPDIFLGGWVQVALGGGQLGPFDSHDDHFFVSQNHSQSSFELIDDGHNLELPPLGTRMQAGHHQDDMKHPLLRSGNSQSLN